MNQCVPSWDLEAVNQNHDIFKYEVAEITWENGQLALHELGSRRVPTKSQPTTSWDQSLASETLEALVNQATHQPYCKTDTPVNDDDLVPWMHHPKPTGDLNQSATTIISDALVPSSNNQTGEAQRSVKGVRDTGCSTRASACSGNTSVFGDPKVVRGRTADANNWSSCRDLSVSDTFVSGDTHARGQRLMSTSTGTPENTSSGRDLSNSTFPDDSDCHRRSQRDSKAVNEKKKEKAKCSILNKRRRTAAVHNQSERKRRDKINQKLLTLQKLVPNSSKTDKASMLEEIIGHIKELQSLIHTANMMNMSPMMTSLLMQQQLQLQKYMMNPMGMGMGGMDMNTIGPSNVPACFQLSAFMQRHSWNNQTPDQIVNSNTMAGGPMPANFLSSTSLPPNMNSYSRMAALYQHMQNQPCGPFPKK